MPRFNRDSNLLDTSINKHITVDILKKWIERRNPSYKGRNYKTQSKMYLHPEVFIDLANKYGINLAFFWCHGINESAYGLSDFAINRNNFWGINANDSNPDDAFSYNGLIAGIEAGAKLMRWGYFEPTGFAYKMAVARGKRPPTINSMAGVWWTSATQADTITFLMNNLMEFTEEYSKKVPMQVVPTVPQPMIAPVQQNVNQTDGDFYIVKYGGWRSQIITEMIQAGVLKGSWQDHDSFIHRLNPTPQGGWKKGDRIRFKEAVVEQVAPIVQEPVIPTVIEAPIVVQEPVIVNDPLPINEPIIAPIIVNNDLQIELEKISIEKTEIEIKKNQVELDLKTVTLERDEANKELNIKTDLLQKSLVELESLKHDFIKNRLKLKDKAVYSFFDILKRLISKDSKLATVLGLLTWGLFVVDLFFDFVPDDKLKEGMTALGISGLFVYLMRLAQFSKFARFLTKRFDVNTIAKISSKKISEIEQRSSISQGLLSNVIDTTREDYATN